MPPSGFQTPILLIVFNRPDLTQKLLEILRKIKPRYLYISADGPRAGRSNERELCAETRAIFDQIDWPCKIKTRFLRRNLGCKMGVSSAIDWFFKHVDAGIILEDDIHPAESFFPYCRDLLERYRENNNIGMISGCNLSNRDYSFGYSYSFMQYFHIWGWATWRRAWKDYDVKMSAWPEIRDNREYTNFFESPNEAEYWKKQWDETFRGEIDTWDHQWTFRNFLNNRLSIVPAVNLIENTGFRADATHTLNAESPLPPRNDSFTFPLKHPKNIYRNRMIEEVSRSSFGTFVIKDDFMISRYRKLRKIAGRIRRFVQRIAGKFR